MDIVTLGAALNGAKKQMEDYVASHFKGGANIEIVDNPDGTQTIHASGEVSSTDTVAREAIVEHVQDDDNPHKVTKSQVGLGNVDNTADLAKPISTATQTALNAKANAVDVYTKAETDALIDSIEVPTALADLTDDTTHRLVTDTEKTKLDGLANIKSVGIGLSLDDTTGELTATGGGTGGTTNYNDLSNKPQINNVVLSGNKSSEDLGLADASDIPTALSDLTDDATHRTVTDTEKTTWNSKSDFSGNYNDLTNKPTIPSSAADVNALPASTLYAGASTAGGAATSANKINTDAGSATQPVYFDNGVPVATTYSLAKSVPADAVFTDTTYESKVATSGGTDVSLCTTGEKYIWNSKQSAFNNTQLAAVNSGIDSTKVAQIATNASDISSLTTAVSAKIGATDYATQTTGGTVKVWTTTESGETTLHISTQ